ncbi:dihydroneopterin aldolase [Synechococcus sp. RSCCF101]|nr:dihydroneopterin aldolase [Synechococcus sp. RSCCF101]
MDAIHVRGLRLWAHVGVLEQERTHGQWFELSFSLRRDLSAAGRADDLEASSDYARGIAALQALAAGLRCRTIEHFSERALDCLEDCFGPLPMWLELSKCRAPVPGFDGLVSVERARRW